MKKNLLIILLIGITINTVAQIAPDKYYIQFTDKNDSPYSIDNPGDFLTQRALDRRDRQGIEIIENDIPVNPQYLQGVADIGVEILNPTKWLNGVTVYTNNPALIDQIEALPYVSSSVKFNYTGEPNSEKFKSIPTDNQGINSTSRNNNSTNTLDYGMAYGQINQLNGIPLHNNGYQGQGMVIAVLDAGFEFVDIHPAFDYLFDNGKILGTYNFVNKGGNVYSAHYHGKMVLSCMGANLPGEMIGTAPEADYWLLMSEYAPYENIIEEYNWMSAAEFADSVGADIINSSLGYIDFDNPTFNHPHSDMDGNTTVITRAADIAASKGILVINSAGNSGSNPSFPWIGAPADGDSVLSIGAVRGNGTRASFSSIGPTADGRIKPTVMAWGEGSTIATGTGGIGTGSGTSFSSPILAGMAACLWQSHSDMSMMEVYESIKESGSYATNPDDYMGWGIPDFNGADSILTALTPPTFDNNISVSPNPFTNRLKVAVNIDSAENVVVDIINMSGNVIMSKSRYLTYSDNTIEITNGLSSLPSGVYFLKVVTNLKTTVLKIVKE